jgi:hypothetical protein
MTQAVVALITIALLTAMSLRANLRFKTERRLPMQWWLNGSVTWTAPRHVALAFTPVLAAVCLAAIVALTTFREPRAGQEHLAIPANIVTALAFLGVHAFHLWLVQRTVQSQR